MSKHLSLLPARPALPRVIAVPAQLGPLVRGLKKATKRTINESAESTVLKSAQAADVDWSEWARFGIGSSMLLYGVYIWCTSGSEDWLAIPTSIASTSSPPSRPPPPASLDSPPAIKDIANNPPPPPPPPPPQSLSLPSPPTSSAKVIAKKRCRRPLRNLLLGAVVSFALYTLTGARRNDPTRGGRGGGNHSGERAGGGGEGSGDSGGDDDDGVEYIAVHDYRTRDNDDSEDDHEAEYSDLDSHDTSRTTTPTLSVSERLLQGSTSLVYDTSIWTSQDGARPCQGPDVTVSSPEPIADLHREGVETEDGLSIFLRSLSTDLTLSPHEGGAVYATPISSTSSREPSSPLTNEPGPSTLQFGFPSPPSLPVGSSGSSPLYEISSSSSPLSPFSEFSPGSLDSLASPGVLVGSSVLGDVQSLNDRLRALPGARLSSGSSDGEDAERGSDYGSDGSWEDIGRAKG